MYSGYKEKDFPCVQVALLSMCASLMAFTMGISSSTFVPNKKFYKDNLLYITHVMNKFIIHLQCIKGTYMQVQKKEKNVHGTL